MQLGQPSLSLLGCQSLKDGCQREREALHDGEGLVKQSHLQQERDDLLCTHKRIWGGRFTKNGYLLIQKRPQHIHRV